MARIVTLTLDDEAGQYLEHLAADQGRTPGEVAAWIVAEDLRRQRCIDDALVARLDTPVPRIPDSGIVAPPEELARERAGA